MNFAAGQNEVKRATFIIDDRVDFGRAATTADAYRLILLPPFAPLAAR